ncbi:Chromate resistance protein ChrB [Hydrogenoanaerobacterium sp.]|uniref:Chromate resistance protein ChrB n=1 Tax=Hydrogenoanaerobacterium sp. TaxID=2953763 RepID=UPI00289C4D21|nr:Chromate resistance protein ChrB [Hydrogenoanaerobacterium sp.]
MATARIRWIALNYNLPINPSKNRVYVWRKLKDVGAVAVNQGISLLPKGSKKVSELVLLCEKIKSLGGEAAIIEMNFVNQKDEQAMIARFEQQSEQEYNDLIANCDNLLLKIKARSSKLDEATSGEIKRLVRQYGRAKSRNHFGASAETEMEKRIDRIFDRCVADASDFTGQLKKLIDKAKF